MTTPLLMLTATCKDNPQCVFQGEDIFLDIYITNPHKQVIEFPLAFIQRTGPSIRLVDNRTHADAYTRTNLADFDLNNQFISIQPGESKTLSWVIAPPELQQFGEGALDINAEITVEAEVRVQGRRIQFHDTVSLHITSQGRRTQ